MLRSLGELVKEQLRREAKDRGEGEEARDTERTEDRGKGDYEYVREEEAADAVATGAATDEQMAEQQEGQQGAEEAGVDVQARVEEAQHRVRRQLPPAARAVSCGKRRLRPGAARAAGCGKWRLRETAAAGNSGCGKRRGLSKDGRPPAQHRVRRQLHRMEGGGGGRVIESYWARPVSRGSNGPKEQPRRRLRRQLRGRAVCVWGVGYETAS